MTPSGSWDAARTVLVAIWELDEGGLGPTSRVIVEPVAIVDYLNDGTTEDEVKHALRLLRTAGYVELIESGGNTVEVLNLGGRALQEVGGWPTGPADSMMKALVAALDREIAASPDEAERSKLERFRDATVGIGRDVLVRVLTDAATGRLPH